MKKHKFESLGARSTGLSHIESKIPCQDDYFLVQGEIGVICLADGAGSCSKSDIGASVITKNVAKFVEDNIKKLLRIKKSEVISILISQIKLELEKLSNQYSSNPNDFSSTLLLVALYKNHYMSIHLGDGLIAKYSNQKGVIHSLPENGEYANHTYFTTHKSLKKHLRITRGKIHEGVSFALMSDGTASILSNGKELMPKALQLFDFFIKNALTQDILNSLIQKIIIPRASNRDDCSIALIKFIPE